LHWAATWSECARVIVQDELSAGQPVEALWGMAPVPRWKDRKLAEW
jgi:hypothetical protein